MEAVGNGDCQYEIRLRGAFRVLSVPGGGPVIVQTAWPLVGLFRRILIDTIRQGLSHACTPTRAGLLTGCNHWNSSSLSYCSLGEAVLSWEARGKYDGFRISSDGKVIADDPAGDAHNFEDKTGPDKGKVGYAVEPTTGKATPSRLVVNLGPPDSGGAIIYEPFDYPANAGELQVC